MSLPLQAVERLFERLMLTYGNSFQRTFDGQDLLAVKSLWAYELAFYAGDKESMQPIAWALENLPETPPNVVVFRNLCRRAPAPVLPMLPEPKADPARIAAEMSKLGEVRKKGLSSLAFAGDGREWARRILGRFDAGQTITATTLRFAREALGTKAGA